VANGGLDLEMPSGKFLNREQLLPAIRAGQVSVATIDDKVRRILRVAATYGWLDRDQTDLSIPRLNAQGRQAALEAAREGLVLLKNEGQLLPLDKTKVKSIAVIGPDAYPAVPVGGGSARVQPFVAVSFLEGLSNALDATANVYYHRGLPTLPEIANATEFSTAAAGDDPGLKVEVFGNPELAGAPVSTRIDRHVSLGGGLPAGDGDAAGFRSQQPFSARWTGYFTPKSAGPHDIFIHGGGEGGGHRLYVDDQLVIDSWRTADALVSQARLSLSAAPHKVVLEFYRTRGFWWTRLRLGIARQGGFVEPAAKALAAKADVVIVTAGFDADTESEGADRTFGLPPGQNELIQEMVAANKSTVVVLTSGGATDMAAWLEAVPAVIQAWYPGQEGGTALAEILLGNVNPSGRLPVTFERRWEDNPVHDSYYPEPGTKRVVYKEGVFVGYRGYERNGTAPLFPFGHGLSYTTFQYGNLAVTPGTSKDGKVRLAFDVTNAGSRAGADVAQVYVADTHAKVPRPPKELKGFAKVSLAPGETRRVTVDLDQRSFSYFDVRTKQWRADRGDFEILVGRSSAQIELRGRVTLTAK
jgi:beta-glucosidase